MSNAIAKSDKRRWTNSIIDPRAQLRMLIPFLILLAINIAGFLYLDFSVRSLLLTWANPDSPRELEIIHQIMLSISIISTVVMATTGLAALALWLRYSHRWVGPCVAINRHIKRLLARDYSESIRLRKHDELSEIADNLNALASQLGASPD